MHRLSHAGFRGGFVRSALLPDWWEESYAQDPNLLPDIEIRVARFLGLPLSAVRDPRTPLTPRAYPAAHLRRARTVDRDRLGPAIHSAIRIAAAVVRSLRDTVPALAVPPPDSFPWREQIKRDNSAPTLADILSDLWLRGIPVVPLDVLPTPNFQGVACVIEDRPVVLLGHKHDEPGRIAFLVAHEVGHIVAGDCAPDQPVVDGEEDIADDTEIEVQADRFATRVLVGSDSVPIVDGENFKELARRASKLERESGADASAVIFAWARRTVDYAVASMAVKALYRSSGARQQLRQFFDRYIDLEISTESDRALLRCVHGDPERDETTG